MMPKLGGLETLDKLKQDPNLKSIPVLMLTNLSGTEDAKTAINKGAVDYLVKSDHTPTEIVEKVKSLLNSSK